jgi:hypothetical protein
MTNAEFIQSQIDTTQKQILLYQDALTAFAQNDAIQHYKIDTGQTVQTVTRANLTEISNIIDKLYNRCATLEARLTGNQTAIGRPSW